MTHRKPSVQHHADMPTVQITSNRNRLKVYDKKTQLPKVYLKGKSHFEFEFFNPLQEKVGITIYLNNKCINEGRMLIIRPGDHGFLERYLHDGDARKFLFDTYAVNDGNEQVKKAIEKNGHIRIDFFKEQEQIDFDAYLNNNYKFSKRYYGSPDNIIYGSGTKLTSTGGFVHESRSGDVIGNNENSVNYCASAESENLNNTLSFFDASQEQTKSAPKEVKASMKGKTRSKKMYKKVETGRIEKGEASDQTFEYTTFTPQILPFHSIEMKLMPESTKSVDINTQTKIYCPGCRYRVRDTNWNFCPKCQTDLRNI